MAAAPISGTPSQILRELPVTEPLISGFESGLFQPKGALYKKDAKGCTKRNQILISIATKKPKVGKNCVLSGGEWIVDFGAKRITKASDVKLLPLMPDNYVYAQGAYGWTEAQRRAYGQDYPKKPWTPKGTRSQMVEVTDSSTQLYSPGSFTFISKVDNLLRTLGTEQRGGDARDAALEAELATLRKQNPVLFDNWTVATLLNAKSWGLSFGPGTYDSFDVTIQQCAAANPEKGDSNPCTSEYTVPNQAARYSITPVPMSASIRPPTPVATTGTGQTARAVPDLSYSAPTGQTIDRSLFGIHAPANWFSDLASGVEGPTDEATIPDVPVGYLRLWDTETTWADIEPVKGQFDWRKLERQIQTAQITDARVMLVLGGTPAWAGDGSRQSPPTNIADWRNYVKTVACRLGPSISAYEIWNEANLTTFWKGTPEQMADLTAAAFEEIRGCGNSNALVVAANTTSRATGSFGTFYPEYLEGLKKRNWPVDAYSVHSYPTASGGANDRIKGIGQFKTMLALAGAPQTTIFDTEINYGLAGLGEGKVDLTGQNAMALMSRTYIDSARYGFASTFWFVWTANPDSKFGIQFTRAAEAEKTAWRTTYDWLVGSQFQKCLETDQALVVCQFSKGGGNFSIVWRGDVGSAPITVEGALLGQLGSRMCDLFSQCEDFTNSSSLTVGFMPRRIDGAPLPAGSSPPTTSETPDDASQELTSLPAIADVTVLYEPSNKADAYARWLPPSDYREMSTISYLYEWQFCKGTTCTTFAKGSVRDRLNTSVDLQKGPGNYRLVLRAQGCRATGDGQCTLLAASDPVQYDFTMVSSRAAPPSDVYLGATGSFSSVIYEAVWSPPSVPTRTIKGYELQVRRGPSPSGNNGIPVGPWETLGVFKGPRFRFPAGDSQCFVGACQVRVRTVMNNGLTSSYVTSAWTDEVSTTMAPPEQYAFATVKGTEITLATTPVASLVFPQNAVQLRYELPDGEWKLATCIDEMGYVVPDAESKKPYSLGDSYAPRGAAVTFSGPGIDTATNFQIRMVNTKGDKLPSPWVDVQWTPISR